VNDPDDLDPIGRWAVADEILAGLHAAEARSKLVSCSAHLGHLGDRPTLHLDLGDDPEGCDRVILR